MKLFISHASEDKDHVARPIAFALRQLGYEVWFDEFSLKLGDSLRRSIDKGLAECDFGIVVLSPDFFSKEWPQKELDALAAKEVSIKKKVILPIWHKVDVSDIAKISPLLADKLGVSTQLGISKVIASLKEVLDPTEHNEDILIKDFVRWSTDKWIKAQNLLFPGSIPAASSWNKIEDIVHVLRTFSLPQANHLFLPSGGGIDMDGANPSLEPDCIEINDGPRAIELLKPKELQFESFAPYYSMSYLRLETEAIRPSGIYDDVTGQREELIEVEPLHYLPRSCWDEGGDYDNEGNFIPLPDNARIVVRRLGGVFLVANKGSLFNHLNGDLDAYSGQYSKMERRDLRNFFQKLIDVAARKNALKR